MNLHTSTPKGWLYDGDVNLEYGGTLIKDLSKAFEEDESFSEYVEVAMISENSVMDKQWWFASGTAHIKRGDPEVEKLIAEGKREEAFLQAYHDAKLDVDTEVLVQIGKPDEYQSSNPAEPDCLYHGNKKLHNVFFELMAAHC